MLEWFIGLTQFANRLLNFFQRLFQGLNDLLKTLPNLGRNVRTIRRFGQTCLFFLKGLLQVIAAFEQAIEVRYLGGERRSRGRPPFCAVMRQNPCIDPIGLGTVTDAFGPVAYLFRVRHTHQPVLLIRMGDQCRFIAASGLNNQVNLLDAVGITKGFDLFIQQLTPIRIIVKLAQFCGHIVPLDSRNKILLGHVDAQYQLLAHVQLPLDYTLLQFLSTGRLARGSHTTWYTSSWLSILYVLSGYPIFLGSGSWAFGLGAAI